MNAANLLTFNKAAIRELRHLWPATITVAGKTVRCNVHLLPVQQYLPGEGITEHRGMSAMIDKTTHAVEPIIGSVVVYDGLSYIVNSVSGRGPTEPAWKIVCIEKERN